MVRWSSRRLNGREVVVEGLPDQLVHERVLARHRRILGDHSGFGRLVEDLEQTAHIRPAGGLQHAEVELAPDDRRHQEHRSRVLGQSRQAAAQQRPHLLGNAERRVGGSVASQGSVVGHETHGLAQEERVAAAEHVQLVSERPVGLGAGHAGEVGLDVVDAQAR